MADPRSRAEDTAPRSHAHASAPRTALGPIIVAPGESAAAASRPEQVLDEEYHIYESNPAPWWVGLLWVAFLVFGAAYLIINLLD